MQTRALALGLLVLTAAFSPLTPAQSSTNEVHLDLSFQLYPGNGSIGVTMQVEDPGQLSELQLGFGDLQTLKNDPRLAGSWEQKGDRAIADLEASPNAKAEWTTNGRVHVESIEGEGFTSYVGDEFAVVKSGAMIPSIRYSFPQGQSPSFSSQLRVDAPDGWDVRGPWNQSGMATFELDRPLPRGFVAAGADLADKHLGDADKSYHIVRLAGSQEAPETNELLLEARSFLRGIYGPTDRVQFIVTAPDPMFRGGLGSPAGVFLHEDADSRVVAHELVHSFQGMRFSRDVQKATVWLAEGSAVVHGSLLEVAAGVESRDNVREFLQSREKEANQNGNAVDLTTAVYGTGNERAAYTKGPVVVTALDDRIREATDNQYTLVNVLKQLNEDAATSPNKRLTTPGFEQTIENVTGYDPSSFFDRFVYGASVPELGSIFPGALSIRVTGTSPSPPVAGEPIAFKVELTNADTKPVAIETPVLVNGTEMGQLVANVSAGSTAKTQVGIPGLDAGHYQVTIKTASADFQVFAPAKPSVNVTTWPRSPVEGENVTIGTKISNTGKAPFQQTVTIELDGRTVQTGQVDVPTGASSTLTHTVAGFAVGPHEVTVRAENGSTLASHTITVKAEPHKASTPAVGWVVVVTLAAGLARLSRAPERG